MTHLPPPTILISDLGESAFDRIPFVNNLIKYEFTTVL